jgi:protein TonB
MTAIDWYEPERRGEFTRLSVAALVVVAVHIAAVLGYLLLRPAPDGGATAPVVDVEFMPSEAAAPAADLAMPEPPAVEPPKEEPPPPPPEPLPQVEAVQPPVEPPPPVQTAPSVEVIPPPAPPKPVEVQRPKEKPVEVKPRHQPHRTTSEEKREEKKEEHKPQRRTAEHQESGSRARVATAPNRGEVGPGAREAEAGWRSALMARLQRAKPGGTREGGMVEISFTMDRSGRVVSRHVARSSGSAALDQAALSMIDRAQPLPAFPPSMREARKTLNVPVRFSVR